MKERHEYLIDSYGVELIVNAEYASKNNLYSLKKAAKYLSNSYVMPCDLWRSENPFSHNELYSWYMVSDEMDNNSPVRANRRQELVRVSESAAGNRMLGISYLTREQAEIVCQRLEQFCQDPS